jgi:hypothetical protein
MLTVTRDLMLPTAITGSYPRPLWFDQSLHGRSFRDALGDSIFREQSSTPWPPWSTPRRPRGSTS